MPLTKQELQERVDSLEYQKNDKPGLFKYYEEVLGYVITQKIGPSQTAEIIVVAHITSILPHFLLLLANIAPIAAIIEKGNVGVSGKSFDEVNRPDSFKRLKAVYNDVITSGKEFRMDEEKAYELVKETIQRGKKVIIVDHGGYFASIIKKFNTRIDDNYLFNCICAMTEHTLNGDEKYNSAIAEYNKKEVKFKDVMLDIAEHQYLPTIQSIATTDLKKQEAKHIGGSIADAIMMVIKDLEDPSIPRNILVVGYGSIGRSIVLSWCQKNNISNSKFTVNVFVCEDNPRTLLQAKQELGALFFGENTPRGKGHFFEKIKDAFAQANPDVIVCATSAYWISNEDLEYLPKKEIFVSCATSADDLFHPDVINAMRTQGFDTENKSYSECNYRGVVYKFLRDGRTANFLNLSINTPVIQAVYASDFCNVLRAVRNQNLGNFLSIEPAAKGDDLEVSRITASHFKGFNKTSLEWTDQEISQIMLDFQEKRLDKFCQYYARRLSQEFSKNQTSGIEDRRLSSLALKGSFTRDQYMNELVELLRESNKIIITGRSVSGKTRVCKEIFQASCQSEILDFQGKLVVWVSCYDFDEYTVYNEENPVITLICKTISQKYNMSCDFFEGDSQDRRLALRECVSELIDGNRVVLLLDDIEKALYKDRLREETFSRGLILRILKDYPHIAFCHPDEVGDFSRFSLIKPIDELLTTNVRATPIPLLNLPVYAGLQMRAKYIDVSVANHLAPDFMQMIIEKMLMYCIKKYPIRAINPQGFVKLAMKILGSMSYIGIFQNDNKRNKFEGVASFAFRQNIIERIESIAEDETGGLSRTAELCKKNIDQVLFSLTPVLSIKSARDKAEKNVTKHTLQFPSWQYGLAALYFKQYYEDNRNFNCFDKAVFDPEIIKIYNAVFRLFLTTLSDADMLVALLKKLISLARDDKAPKMTVVAIILNMYCVLNDIHHDYLDNHKLGKEDGLVAAIQKYQKFFSEAVIGEEVELDITGDDGNFNSSIVDVLLDEYAYFICFSAHDPVCEKYQDLLNHFIPNFEKIMSRRLIAYVVQLASKDIMLPASFKPEFDDREEIEDKQEKFGRSLVKDKIEAFDNTNPFQNITSFLYYAIFSQEEISEEIRAYSFYDLLLLFSDLSEGQKFGVFVRMLGSFEYVKDLSKFFPSLASSLFIAVAYQNKRKATDNVMKIRQSAIVLLTQFISFLLIKEYSDETCEKFFKAVQAVEGNHRSIDRISTTVNMLTGIVSQIIRNQMADDKKELPALFSKCRDLLGDYLFNANKRTFLTVMLGENLNASAYVFALLTNIYLLYSIFIVLLASFLSSLDIFSDFEMLTNEQQFGLISSKIYLRHAFFVHLITYSVGFIFARLFYKSLPEIFSNASFIEHVGFDFFLRPFLNLFIAVMPAFFLVYGTYVGISAGFSVHEFIPKLIPFFLQCLALLKVFVGEKIEKNQLDNSLIAIDTASKTTETFMLHLMLLKTDPDLLLTVITFLLSVTPESALGSAQRSTKFFSARKDDMKKMAGKLKKDKKYDVMSIRRVLPAIRHHLGIGGHLFEKVNHFLLFDDERLFGQIIVLLNACEGPKRGAGVYLFLMALHENFKDHLFENFKNKYITLFRQLISARENEIDLISILLDVAINELVGKFHPDDDNPLQGFVDSVLENIEGEDKIRFIAQLKFCQKNISIEPEVTIDKNEKYAYCFKTDIPKDVTQIMEVVSSKLNLTDSFSFNPLKFLAATTSQEHAKCYELTVMLDENKSKAYMSYITKAPIR